jgi:hypothetical protein
LLLPGNSVADTAADMAPSPPWPSPEETSDRRTDRHPVHHRCRTARLVPREENRILSLPVDGEVEFERAHLDLTRVLGAFDGDRCVGTMRSMPRMLTVPEGAEVAASAITNVTVSPTHRRRGVLSRMMARELAGSHARGEAVAILVSSEYPIYGRFGFGPATWTTSFEIDILRAALPRRMPQPAGLLDLADPAEVRAVAPALHDRFRRTRPGAINRDDLWWELSTGAVAHPRQPWTEPSSCSSAHRPARSTGC